MAFAAALLALAASGCLPVIPGTAQVLRPGESSFAVAGLERIGDLPTGAEGAGPTVGVIEARTGLPTGGTDTGLTLQVPWSATWDLKQRVLDEGRGWPAVAVQMVLGAAQPAIGGNLLVSRGFGPVVLTAMGGAGRTNERLWRGADPFADDSETVVRDSWALGGSIDIVPSPVHRLFIALVTWKPFTQYETPPEGRKAYGMGMDTELFVYAGLRIIVPARPRGPVPGATEVLRGWMMTDYAKDRFDMGQPGLYRATVLTDAYTRIIRDGRPAPAKDLLRGRAVLVEGIPLPQRSTFLARTIELQ